MGEKISNWIKGCSKWIKTRSWGWKAFLLAVLFAVLIGALHLLRSRLDLDEFQFAYVAASIWVIVLVGLFGFGWWSPFLPKNEE